MNAIVQDMKVRIANGQIGAPRVVRGNYIQDWLFLETDYNWRLEPEFSGASRAVADIGSHWMDLAQTVLGEKIVAVCADIATLTPNRKKIEPNDTGETVIREFKTTTEDYAVVMVRFSGGTRGVYSVSQVSAGYKCRLDIAIDGEKASYYWNQEEADRLWIGHRETNNELVFRDPVKLMPEVQKYTYMPAGHPEGWNDALYNNINAFYRFILSGKTIGKDSCDFATFEEAHYIQRLIDAILRSAQEQRWIAVNPEMLYS
jgi:predicted dehydrogenase